MRLTIGVILFAAAVLSFRHSGELWTSIGIMIPALALISWALWSDIKSIVNKIRRRG